MEEDNALPCVEKMVFNTRKEAQAVGTAADWQYGGSLTAYKCQYCHLYHLSSQPSSDD